MSQQGAAVINIVVRVGDIKMYPVVGKLSLAGAVAIVQPAGKEDDKLIRMHRIVFLPLCDV